MCNAYLLSTHAHRDKYTYTHTNKATTYTHTISMVLPRYSSLYPWLTCSLYGIPATRHFGLWSTGPSCPS